MGEVIDKNLVGLTYNDGVEVSAKVIDRLTNPMTIGEVLPDFPPYSMAAVMKILADAIRNLKQ